MNGVPAEQWLKVPHPLWNQQYSRRPNWSLSAAMECVYRRVGSVIPQSVSPSVWLGECRLLFLSDSALGRMSEGRFFGTWGEGEKLFLGIIDASDKLRENESLKNLPPGFYIDIPAKARIADRIFLKPGVREVQHFLRSLQSKKLRGEKEEIYKFRSNVLRKIIEEANNFDLGLYQMIFRNRLTAEDNALVNTGMLNSETASSTNANDILPNQSLVRMTDSSGSTNIFDCERRFRESIQPHLSHALRTKPVDFDAIEKTVADLYLEFDLIAPPVVVLPNPLSTAIAGAYATALLLAEKNTMYPSTVEIKYPAKSGLLSEKVSDAICRRADRASMHVMDKATTEDLFALARRVHFENLFDDDAVRFLHFLEVDEGATNRNPHSAIRWHTAVLDFTRFRRNDAFFADWKIDFAPVCKAINSVVLDPFDLYEHEKNEFVRTGLEELADKIAGEVANQTAFEIANEVNSDVVGEKLRMKDLMIWSLYARQQLLLSSNIRPFASFAKNVLNIKLPIFDQYALWEKFALEGAAFVMHKEFCFISDFPEIIEMDERHRLHSANGPAIKWRDGWKVYHWHGTSVPDWVIEEPDRITIDAINKMENQEIRRVMIEIYGPSRYLTDSGAQEVQQDEYGILYRHDIPDDEPLSMVRVKNSTPEPDGSIKEYWLRVPPDCTTAKAGVAWTFHLEEKDYEPKIET
jgi:hypothetical protein